MKRFITIITLALLTTSLWSQKFNIPTTPGKKTVDKSTAISEPARKQGVTTTTTTKKQKTGYGTLPKTQTKTTIKDLTAGQQVEGIDRSITIAELEKEAQKGNASAHAKLGMYYYHQNDERALPHLIAGNKGGDILATYYLGGVYYFGKFGIKEDKKTAATCYLKAAERNHVPAQYGIAICLYNGEGVKMDRKAAREWMEKAAKGNSKEAKDFLASHSFE